MKESLFSLMIAVLFVGAPVWGFNLNVLNLSLEEKEGAAKIGAAPNLASASQIAFASERDGDSEIYLINTNGTNLKKLTDNTVNDSAPSWSPDGTRLVFASQRSGSSQLWTMNSDGSNQTRLVTDANGWDSWPIWSPDGNRIVFSRWANHGNDGESRWEGYVINADGTGMTRLTNSSVYGTSAGAWPSGWTPDSTQVLFHRYRDGRYQLWIMNSNGSDQHSLISDSFSDSMPSMSPFGTRIAFASNRDGQTEIYTMKRDGSDVTRLTSRQKGEWWPTWSQDGSKIIFESNRDGYTQVYWMNADGSQQTRLTNGTVWEGQPAWRPAPVTPAEKAWTIIHYMAADNDADMQQSLAWEYGRLHLAATNSAINVVALWDSLSTSTRYVAFPQGQDGVIVDKGELDTGNPATLRDFVTWAKSNYPARHYALVISDHGTGLGGVALDRHAPSYVEAGDPLTPAELKQALMEAGLVDVLYMNACSMGMIEGAYQVRGGAAYYVASEAPVWGPMAHDTYALGWQRGGQAIPAITSQTGAEELATNMALAATWMMRDNSGTSRPGTMSACTLSKLGDVVAKASGLAQQINSDMFAQAPLLQTMTSPTVLQHFEMNRDYQITEADDYVDLYHFAQVMQALSNNAGIRSAAGELMSAIDDYCVYAEGWSGTVVDESSQVHTWTHANSHGVSIFFPQPAWYNVFYNVDWLDFAIGTNWHTSALAASDVAGGTIEWGPMLAQFVRTVNQGAPDNATPPPLLQPLTTLTCTYLPLLLR